MTDYNIMALEEELAFNQAMYNDLISVIESEHNFIMNVLLEDGEEGNAPASQREIAKRNRQQTKAVNRKNSLYEKIKIIFQNFIKSFKQKAINNAETWLNANLATLNQADYSKIQVTIIYYQPVNNIKNYVTKILDILERSSREYLTGTTAKTVGSAEELQQAILKEYFDEKGSLGGGLVTKFKLGDAKKKPTTKTLTGDAAKTEVDKCIQYCKTYSSEIVTWVQTVMDRVESDIRQMETLVSPAKESVHTSIIESFSTDISILMEEPATTQTSNQPANQNNTNQNNQNAQGNNARVGVKVIGDNSANNKSNTGNSTLNAFYKTEQLVVTSLMTAMEAIMFDYLKILHAVYDTIPKNNSAPANQNNQS